MSWLDEFMEATDAAESPRAYFYWAGVSAIAASVRNRVWINKYLYKLYPNLYILLIGKSGLRKSSPISIAKSLVDSLEVTKVIYGRASIQAIVQRLGEVEQRDSGTIIKESSAYVVSSEFAASLVKDDAALTIMTDLADGHYHEDGWKNTLKSAASDRLDRPCVNLLSASNQTHFEDVVDSASMFGGFIARTVLVVEHKKSKINDLLDAPDVIFDPKKFVPYLKKISQVKGEFSFTPKAKRMFQEWYHEFAANDEIEDRTGTSERVHDRILKVAMCLSLADDLNLVINDKQMAAAMRSCIHGVSLANKATMHQGKSEMSPKTAVFIKRLVSCEAQGYTISKEMMVQREWGNMDTTDVNKIAETLEVGGLIKQELINGEIYYTLLPKFIDKFKEISGS